MYYLSRCLHGGELNYPSMENYCLALVFATQRLHHYILAHKLMIVTRSDPIKFLLSMPALLERIAKWLLLLGEFDIAVVQPKAIKFQALSYFLVHFPSQYGEIIPDSILGEFYQEICFVNTEEKEWDLYFDGFSTANGRGDGIVLISPSR